MVYFFIDKNMTKNIEKIKESLERRRVLLLQELKDLSKKDSHEEDNKSAIFPNFGSKPDENAQEISEYSTVVMAEKVLEKTIEEIDDALERIKKGTYGICKYCGHEINEKRLLARPTASSCIDCKTKLQG